MVLSNLEWTFTQEISVPKDIQGLLAEGENPFKAFKTVRDVAVFTNKRLIVSDAQGITGRKKEIYSLPYKSIIMWSTENAGTIDINSEVELWTRAGNLKIKLKRGIDIRAFDRLLSQVVL
ncbi:MAG TPA: PH domain-containing protein [Atopostipes sp.]|nr:PH domain-containing protein [Atopostipes sp.]